MNAKVPLVAGGVLLAAGVAAFVVFRRGAPAAPVHVPITTVSSHGRGIDRATAPVGAMYTAPEGDTPCESALNAIKAEQDASAERGSKSRFIKVAERDEFLARCRELPGEAQQCLVPKYLARHRDECTRVKPAPEVLKAMFEMRTDDEPKEVVPASDLPPPRGKTR
jgi:hypothetical protein